MLRTLGIWVIAAAAVASVALQLEERQDRATLLNEQRYQSCMAQNIGGAVNLLQLDTAARLSAGGDEDSIYQGEGRQLPTNLDEAISRCSGRFAHTTTPTTARR